MKKLFEFDSEHTINQFVSIDDRVMGGVSRSAVIRCTPKSACFKGVVVPDNGGGFASVRSTAISLTNNDAVGFELDYSGDGKVYKFRVLSSRVEDSIVYQASFSTISGVRQQVKFEFETFIAARRGRVVSGAPRLTVDSITGVGFLISDRQFGPFSLELFSIGLFGSDR